MKKELNHLKKFDKKLYEIALKINLSPWKKSDDPFIDLIESIINQQLSGNVAAAIFGRLKMLFPKEKITPKKLISINDQEIRNCGISTNKTHYIKGLARAIIDKEIKLENLENMENEEVISELTKLKGVGVWTAEMYLMFTLNRQDIFSAEDVGIKNAMIKLYGLNNPTKKKLIKISSKWSPYRTTACRVLWRSLEL